MTQDEKKILELLPQGQFIINRKSQGPVKGRFSMYVLELFCQKKKIDNYLTLIEKIVIGMSVGDYADLVLLAIDDYYRNQETKSGFGIADIMDMIDETLNGVSSDEFNDLIQHAVGRVANVKKMEKAINDKVEQITKEQEEQKKSSLSDNSTSTLSE